MAELLCVYNPASGQNRGTDNDQQIAKLLAARLPGLFVPDRDLYISMDVGGLLERIQQAKQEGVKGIIVAGGDGTTQTTVNACFDVGGELPFFLVLDGGSNNVTSHESGFGGQKPLRTLEWFADHYHNPTSRDAHAVFDVIQYNTLQANGEHGFLFTTGLTVPAFSRYDDILASLQAQGTGKHGLRAKAQLTVEGVASACTGTPFYHHQLMHPRSMEITVDDKTQSLPYTAILAGTHPYVGFGTLLYDALDEPEGFQILSTNGRLAGVLLGLAAASFNRKSKHLTLNTCAQKMTLRPGYQEGYILDGEKKGPVDAITLSLGGPVRLICNKTRMPRYNLSVVSTYSQG
ncbi:hypothetical protein HZB01_03225 [Candidatus Woesearchaeota archaeon]|nr:hypothetical protein [Candidatus Woesearchaeota archaeon]